MRRSAVVKQRLLQFKLNSVYMNDTVWQSAACFSLFTPAALYGSNVYLQFASNTCSGCVQLCGTESQEGQKPSDLSVLCLSWPLTSVCCWSFLVIQTRSLIDFSSEALHYRNKPFLNIFTTSDRSLYLQFSFPLRIRLQSCKHKSDF